jgi:hypothetical protein
MNNYGNYRIPNPCDKRGFTYFASYGDALVWGMEARAEMAPDDPMQIWPIEVRCNIHGWTMDGGGDVCNECHHEAMELAHGDQEKWLEIEHEAMSEHDGGYDIGQSM